MNNTTTASRRSPARTFCLAAIGVLLLLAGALYLWKLWTERSAGKQLEAQRTELARQAAQALNEQTIELLRFSSIPLAWAIRSELINANYDQINRYFNEFIKEPYLRQMVLVRPDGNIVLATNKKLEGQEMAAVFPAGLMQQDRVVVDRDERGDIRVAVPIMGLNEKLGLLVVTYAQDSVQKKLAGLAPAGAGGGS